MLDALDRRILNELQRGLPVVDHPYAQAADTLGCSEDELLERLKRLLDERILTRFGPMYHAERLGGALSLCAMRVSREDFEEVADIVNALPEVAHNYERDHEMNMWFVLATERADDIARVIARIEVATGYRVYNMPKEAEYYVGLQLSI
jgi:DNA-binding Lrp family transcriptional regulator